MLRRNSAILAIALLPVLALGLAACGGNNSSDSASAANGSGSETVATKSIAGAGDVLVDSSGAALYTNNMDRGSKIACTGECAGIWVPLAAPSSGKPTSSDSSVQDELGVVSRPDGSSQVTMNGKPLYSFVQDSPGQVTGDGVSDSFGGTDFTWTVASPGASAGGSAATTTSSSSSSGGGGYGY
jgi:predicted lipoprotein with Yx(FWY)xxD motif